jgi:hypothetical protein
MCYLAPLFGVNLSAGRYSHDCPPTDNVTRLAELRASPVKQGFTSPANPIDEINEP